MMHRVVLFLAICLGIQAVAVAADRKPSTGQTLYIPVYAYVWHGNRDSKGIARLSEVATLVSVRNTDPLRSLKLMSAKYHATSGKQLAEWLPQPKTLAPLETAEFFIDRSAVEGGSGASVILRWEAGEPVNPPVAQALHLDVKTNSSLSFTTNGVVVERPGK
ncbi:MAG: DUF3124 domain-containing protein [Burkholderiales bacterium]